jgi:hypothetical protein
MVRLVLLMMLCAGMALPASAQTIGLDTLNDPRQASIVNYWSVLPETSQEHAVRYLRHVWDAYLEAGIMLRRAGEGRYEQQLEYVSGHKEHVVVEIVQVGDRHFVRVEGRLFFKGAPALYGDAPQALRLHGVIALRALRAYSAYNTRAAGRSSI